MKKTNSDKEELEKLYKELQETNENNDSNRNDLLSFFIGLLMLAGGLFMIFQNLDVSSSWGNGFFRIGTFQFANGLIMLPLIIGIAMLFLMKRKIFGWVALSIGIVIVLLSVLMTAQIHWRRTNAYVFIIMFGLTAAGGGMVIRELFRKK